MNRRLLEDILLRVRTAGLAGREPWTPPAEPPDGRGGGAVFTAALGGAATAGPAPPGA